MTTYIKLSTLEYPRHEGDIRLEYPEITEDQTGDMFPCPNTYAMVLTAQTPECDYSTQTIEELPPTQVQGVWTQQLLVRNLTVEELQAKADMLAEMESLKVLQAANMNPLKQEQI